MRPILELNNVTGGYNPRRSILHGLSFQVGPGEMVGMIGLNGAGKSTTMKHILGLLHPKEGQILVKGKSLLEAPDAYRQAYAYVPESPMVYEEMTVREHLRFVAMAYDVEEARLHEWMESLAALFQMNHRLDSLPGHLSKGMRQKLMLLAAFLVKPELYLIDEPFLGLDPLGIRALLELMVERKREGAGILLCSHILSTIEKYCDAYVLLHEGRIVASGSLEQLREKADLPGSSLEDVFFELVRQEGA
jgi:ABC-2 type transport system ATP-binding protein